ncbi:DUF541 domain-containing protein [Gemmata obscuriglobus]|uniref:DUF541 domain-containing protein n=2 Tax=Gemmata obscuriglobus TaxID=114 RepID=A0A2Z3H3Q3_9BACT|nr:DUF541 domain-containing protein [Gemmata obscuriglobus]
MVSANATAVVRQRPSVLLMIARVRAAGATLDASLAEMHQLADDTVRRLMRLGATRAWAGDSHPDDQADPDPIARMRAAAGRGARGATPEDRRGVNVAVAATWDITGLSADAVLSLVDQLRFDVAANVNPSEPTSEREPLPWADPAAQIQHMIAKATQPEDDRSPKFVYIARPTDEQLTRASAEAYRAARGRAERLARAAGRQLGVVSSLNYGHAASVRPDRMMTDQRCSALLAAVGYVLEEDEVASDDPRATELAVTVHVSHYLAE